MATRTRGNQAFWQDFKKKHPGIAQFIVFFIISNGVTVLQMVLMPAIKWIFSYTALVGTSFQILPVGSNLDGSAYLYSIMQQDLLQMAAAEGLLIFWQ